MRKYNVLSLFDGAGIFRLSLHRQNIPVNKYFASEIDKHAVQLTTERWPDIEHLGDVRGVTLKGLPPIDIIAGGPPCQDLSITQSKKRQGLEGSKSSLFYEFLRLVNACKAQNPDIKIFMENVYKMPEESRDVISRELGLQPVMINSGLVSAQNRMRLYWSNIKIKEFPRDKRIVLKDIIVPAEEVPEKYWLKKEYNRNDSFSCFPGFEDLAQPDVAARLNIKGHEILKRVNSVNSKCPTLTTIKGGSQAKKVMQNGRPRNLMPIEYERAQTWPDNYTAGFSDGVRYDLCGNGWTAEVIDLYTSNLRNNR